MPREQLIDTRVEQHLEQLVPARHPVLTEMEALAKERGFPIIGPVVGHLCYQITRMIRAERVFELGSGFGYSTAWFARGIRENGGERVVHTVWDEQLSTEARSFVSRLGYEDLVEFHVGESIGILEQTDGPFDILFNDIDKEAYPDSLDAIAAKLRPGGVLIVDNLLWHGRIFDRSDESPATQGVRELTRRLTQDPAWVSSLVPIRDGVMVAYRQ